MDPFSVETDKPLVALKETRNGYITIATSQNVEHYAEWSSHILQAAHAWAMTLEKSGCPRAYWITLSEMVRHLHIHIFPRWPEDTLKGIMLFESRNTELQPTWTPQISTALEQWAKEFNVKIIEPS
jgi:diadenosine tetraphosphate (Ap4A) HIT family hydrolase